MTAWPCRRRTGTYPRRALPCPAGVVEAAAGRPAPPGTRLVSRAVRPDGRPGRGLAGQMDRAGPVPVPGRADHDECRGHDLDPAEHDEHAGVNGDGPCRGQNRRQQPYLKCQPADARRAAGPDQVGDLRDVGCPGQPGAGKARDLRDGQHRWLQDRGAWSCPRSVGVITAARGAAASSGYAAVARPVDVVVILTLLWARSSASTIVRVDVRAAGTAGADIVRIAQPRVTSMATGTGLLTMSRTGE